MPEVPICTYCKKSINTANDYYVVTNKDDADSQDEWIYAHLECHDKAIEKYGTPPQ